MGRSLFPIGSHTTYNSNHTQPSHNPHTTLKGCWYLVDTDRASRRRETNRRTITQHILALRHQVAIRPCWSEGRNIAGRCETNKGSGSLAA